MTFTYDTSTKIGKVRLLVPDAIAASATFDDAEIAAFLAMNADDFYLAAAQAVDVVASNETLVLKAMTIQGVTTNGPAVASALRAHAASLREKAGWGDILAGDENFVAGEYIGVGSAVVDEFTWREMRNE